MEQKVLDMVIIGSGPAGLTAAIYAARAKMNFVILEKMFSGGQINNTYEIENYPGMMGISGFELGTKFREHLEAFDIKIKTEEVLNLEINDKIKKVITNDNVYETRTIVLGTGAISRNLGIESEQKFAGRGVAYCATCDGAFYKDKITAVIGGSYVAVEDAIYLSRICKKVYLVHRRDKLRAEKGLQEKLFEIDNIEVVWDSNLVEITGEQKVEGMKLYNNKSNEETELAVDGIFIAVGSKPMTGLLKDKVDMNEKGYIITGENCMTSVDGIFAIGDIREKSLRQVITACADGAIAVYNSERFIP